MRFMTLWKPTVEPDGRGPTPEEQEKMGRLIEEMMQEGILLGGDGLAPSAKGARVESSGGKIVVRDGPFAETKELVAGYAILEVKSKAEAIEQAVRFLKIVGVDGVSEVRQMHDAPER